MNLKDLENLIAGGESESVEFKKSTGQRTLAAKTVCAMSNGLGGFVLFGVTDKGEAVGQRVVAKTLEDITAELRRIEPPVFPDIETIALTKDLSVILLRISGGGGPYVFNGQPYVRYGPTTSLMPRDIYEKNLIAKLHATYRWENEPVPDGVTIGDLDAEEIQITLDNAVRLGRLETVSRSDAESVLRGLELIKNDKLLNAAVVLYGKSDQLKIMYPQMGIRMARFRGKNRLADFSDNRQYWGHAFSLMRRAENFLMDHVPIAGRVIPGKMIREDQPWYPPRATREALANAFCHRDYTNAGGAVAVAMYDDHLEITNPGELQFGITPEKLTQPHESRPWNPIIANVFYRAGIIERWGMGTLNIIDWCSENGNPPPTWNDSSGSVFVSFLPAVLPDIKEIKDKINEREKDHVETKPGLSQDQAGTKSGLSQDQVEILNSLSEERVITELMESVGRANRTKFREQILNPLIEIEFVEMTIPEKPTSSKQKYRLTEKGQKELEQILGL